MERAWRRERLSLVIGAACGLLLYKSVIRGGTLSVLVRLVLITGVLSVADRFGLRRVLDRYFPA